MLLLSVAILIYYAIVSDTYIKSLSNVDENTKNQMKATNNLPLIIALILAVIFIISFFVKKSKNKITQKIAFPMDQLREFESYRREMY